MTGKEGRSHGGEENRRALFTRYIKMRIVSLYVSIQRHHWQLLSVHLELTVPTQPMMLNDVMCCVKVDHTSRVYVPYSFQTVM